MTCPDPSRTIHVYYECGVVYEVIPGYPRRMLKDLRKKRPDK